MRDRRAAQAEALAVLRAGLRDDAANHPEALARLPADLDAFVEVVAAAAEVLAEYAALSNIDEDN